MKDNWSRNKKITMSPYSKCLSDSSNNQMKSTDSDEEDYSQGLFTDLRRRIRPTTEGRVIYISRHGESMYNLENRIGGNPSLSPQGMKYAKALGNHVNSWEIPDLKVQYKIIIYTQFFQYA